MSTAVVMAFQAFKLKIQSYRYKMIPDASRTFVIIFLPAFRFLLVHTIVPVTHFISLSFWLDGNHSTYWNCSDFHSGCPAYSCVKSRRIERLL